MKDDELYRRLIAAKTPGFRAKYPNPEDWGVTQGKTYDTGPALARMTRVRTTNRRPGRADKGSG